MLTLNLTQHAVNQRSVFFSVMGKRALLKLFQQIGFLLTGNKAIGHPHKNRITRINICPR